MDNKKHIVNLESFRDMLHICSRVHGQIFDEPPFKEEILAFIRFLRHGVPIRMLTDVNINKLYQPWRSFAAIINKCLTGKSSGYDSLRLSQAQILWGLYHKRNVDYAYLMDDFMLSMIKLVSRHQNTQQFGALLPIELTNDEIVNSNAYKEHYAVATGEAAPKPKASVRRTKSGSDTSMTAPTAAASLRLTASAKGKQTAKASKAKSLSALSKVTMIEAQHLKLVTKQSRQQMHISQASSSGADEGTGSIPWVPDVPTDESKEELLWNSTDDEGADEEGKDGDDDEEDEGDDGKEGNGDKDDDGKEGDDDDQEVVKNDDKNDAEESRDDDKEGEGDEQEYEEEEDELYRDVNINQGRGLQATLEVEDTHVALTPVKPDENFSEVMPTNQFAGAVSAILGIVQQYMDQRMNKAVKVAVQIQSDQLCDEAQKENDEFLRTVDANIKKIIKEQVKEQVNVQVSKILPRIEQAVNEQLKTKVLTRLSHSSRNSYAVAADLSEMELKKILIEKIEGNKSIQRSDEQSNMYKALVDAYESDKIILDTYRETVTLKRRRDDDEDKDEEPSVGPDRGQRDAEKGRKRQQFYDFAVNQEFALDVYSKRRIIAITELKIVEWHSYKHLDWITVRRDDDKLYKFKKGDFKRLRIQDIEDMLLLLVQGKLTNLTVEERFAFNVSLRMEEGQDEEDDEDELYRDVNINLEGRIVHMADVHTTQEFKDTHVTLTPVNPDGQQQSSSVSSQFVTSMLNPTPDAGIDSIFKTTSQMDVQAPPTLAPLTLSAPTLTPSTITTISTDLQAPTTAPSTLLQDLPNFGSLFGFDHRLKTLEANFSKFMQTNQFAGAVSSIPGIVQRYMDQQMNETVKTPVHIKNAHIKRKAKRRLKRLNQEVAAYPNAGSESRPPMLNKENYVPWSSRLLRYAKSRPNIKLIHNSILNGPYVRRIIPEPGDANREVTVTETFHVQTNDELSDKEIKQIEADDQAIQTILLGLPEDIYAAVDSCETAQEIWLQVQQMMKGSEIEIQEKKVKLFNE
nr:hypothetical protein [Tanacetum cinerariifolium]